MALSATATFYNANIQGTFTFTQPTAADPVSIVASLEGLDSKAGGYHVHQYPVTSGGSGFLLNAIGTGCGADITAGHFNPAGVDTGEGYDCSFENQLGCEAGDLAGRFGSLAGLDVFDLDEVDQGGLTLFGDETIIGRSVVIHEPSGARLACATILPESTRSLVATFTGDEVSGTLTLFDDGSDNPSFFADLETSVTTPFEITLGSTTDLELSLTELCNSLAPTEKRNAMFTAQGGVFRTVAPSDVTVGPVMAARISFENGLFVCIPFGKTVIAHFDHDGLAGGITLSQLAEDEPVKIDISLSGLEGRVGGFHVHVLPVRNETDCARSEGHFNPLGASGTCDVENALATCEAGDLAGKHGSLSTLAVDGTVDVSVTETATGLNLFGVNSIVGRSIVIHDTDGGRFTCANLYEDVPLLIQEATFEDGPITGYIRLFQSAVDAGAETAVQVFATLVEEGDSTDHKWHIHENAISDGSCDSVGGHFNPAGVNGGAGFTGAFPYQCPTGECETGDLASKHELLSFPLTGKVYSDSSLPLSGWMAVANRSIVVHVSDAGGDKLDCASLVAVVVDEGEETTDPPTDAPGTDDPFNNTPFIVILAIICVLIVAVMFVMTRGNRSSGIVEEEKEELTADPEAAAPTPEVTAPKETGDKSV